jgi:hypothetical protein
MKNTFDMGSGGMTYRPSFMKIDRDIQPILRILQSNMRDCNVGITDGRNLWIEMPQAA